ncbi:MAG TPA: putative S-layer protein [Bacteroidia bacterium]|nr:putative S-layer protein [Bacteroidia bacterium]
MAFLSISLVFAASFAVTPTSLKFAEPQDKATFTITPQNNVVSSYTVTFPSILQENGQPVLFSLANPNDLVNINAAKVITINANVDYNEISIGKTYSGNMIVQNANDANDTLTVPITITSSFCSAGEKGTDLEISDVSIDNSDGDDDEWSPLDQVEISVEVSNNGNEKIKDVFVTLGIYDSAGKNIVKDLEDLDDDEIKLGSINDGDEDTATFNFIVPADFESGNFRLVVKAFSDDLGENVLCIAHASDLDNSVYQSITGDREEDEEKQVIFHNIKLTPSPAQCGDRVQVTGEVANIGDEDYEDQVKVTIFNQELDLNTEKIVRKDLDQGDSELVDFEFDVPQDTQEKSYIIEFKTHYEYDEDDDDYGITSDEEFTQSLRVEGGCGTVPTPQEGSNVVVSAQLNPDTPQAIAGQQLVINARLQNTGTTETNYVVSITGNNDWAQVVSVEPKVVTLAPGQSRDVAIVLLLNNDVSGDKEFVIRTTFDGKTKDQRVSVPIATEPVSNDQLSPVLEHLRANWFIYLIILVNVILIIAIILVIRSMVSPVQVM